MGFLHQKSLKTSNVHYVPYIVLALPLRYLLNLEDIAASAPGARIIGGKLIYIQASVLIQVFSQM